MTEQEREANQNKILETAYIVRGIVLQRAIEIETLIEGYITDHFSNDIQKKEELVTLILAPRVSFENKAQVFIFLLGEYKKDFAEKIKVFKENIIKIGEIRNHAAHFPVEFSDYAISVYQKQESIILIKFKNNGDKRAVDKTINRIHFTKGYVNDYLTKCIECMKILKELSPI